MLQACQPGRLSNQTVSPNQRLKEITAILAGGGYFFFMIITMSVANAIMRYIASTIEIILPPPFLKGVANRPSTTCCKYYSIIFQQKDESSLTIQRVQAAS